MPSISMFYGIIIYMLYDDTKEHNLPHVHVKYSGETASFCITTGKLLAGKLPPKQTKLVQAWIMLRKEELQANWTLALQKEVLYKIDPLK